MQRRSVDFPLPDAPMIEVTSPAFTRKSMSRRTSFEPKDFESEYTTLSGWITELLDHFPEEGDTFSYERISGTVKAVDGPLVEQAEIRVAGEEEEKEQENLL